MSVLKSVPSHLYNEYLEWVRSDPVLPVGVSSVEFFLRMKEGGQVRLAEEFKLSSGVSHDVLRGKRKKVGVTRDSNVPEGQFKLESFSNTNV